MSVIDYVDKILLWDTGSSDRTLEIIEEIKKVGGNKIDFREVGPVDIVQFTKVRQLMLEETKSDWFLIVDGDEVWWEKSIKEVIQTIHREGDRLESMISLYFNIIGDIYHYQEESAGRYHIDQYSGHINIRAVRRDIPGLHFAKPHGQQGLYDKEGTLIQERDKKQRKFISAPYLHFTNMIRSSTQANAKVPKRSLKFKYEIGLRFPPDFQFPEVFYQPKPDIVSSPWEKMSRSYFLRACGETVLKKLKRKIITPRGFGY